MALGKAAAVVTGSFDLGESDRGITVDAREYGKVRGVAEASGRVRLRFGWRRDRRGVRGPGAGRDRYQPGRGGRAGTPARGALGGGAGPAPRPRRGRAAGGAGSTHDTTDRPADAHREVPARGTAAVRDDRRAAMRHSASNPRRATASPGPVRAVGVGGANSGPPSATVDRPGFPGARRGLGVWGPIRGPHEEP